MHDIKLWLREEDINLHLKAGSELEAIWAMLKVAARNPAVKNTKLLAKSVYENEVLHASHGGSTGITFYALTDAVINPLMVVGHFDKGIGYYSKTKKPIDIVVLLAAPVRFAEQLQNMIFCVKDMLEDCDFLDDIRYADNPAMVYQYFKDLCLKLSVKNKSLEKLPDKQVDPDR